MSQGRDPTVLVLGSLPLAAPWNGADKNVARALVLNDAATRFLIQTGRHDRWPEHVRATRVDADAQPTARSEILGLRHLATAVRSADLVHIVASVRRPSSWRASVVAGIAHATRRPLLHTAPSLADAPFTRLDMPGDITVVFSEESARRLRAVGVQNVVELFPPLDMRMFESRVDVCRTRARLGIHDRAILVATHLGPGDGVDTAIRALALLPPDLSATSLVVAARWRSRRDGYARAAEMGALAASLGVEDRLRILHDPVDLVELISACTLSVLVPRALDGKMDLPLAILESLAVGRPVILSDVPRLRDALLGGGVLVPPECPGRLASAMTDLLRDRGLRDRLAARGRSAVRDRGDAMRIARAYRELYSELLS